MRIASPRRGNRSQIAVIITFVIALLILFTLVLSNIAKISDIKTLTAMSADRNGLALASALSQMINAYAHQVNPDNPSLEHCATNWAAITALVAAVCGIILAAFTFGASIPLTGVALGIFIAAESFYAFSVWKYSNDAIMWASKEGMPRLVSMMSTHSATRESALFNAASGVMTDTVLVEHISDGRYIDRSTNTTFDLKDSVLWPSIQKKLAENKDLGGKFQSRFSAWYYDKRANVVSEGAREMSGYLQREFIKYMIEKMYFRDGDWNREKWQYEKVSFPVYPAAAPVTCGSPSPVSCPTWVTPEATRRVVVLGPMDINDPDYITYSDPEGGGMIYYLPNAGFLNDKFKELCHRIRDKLGNDRLEYPGGYISKGGWFFGLGDDDAPIDDVISDLKDFLRNLLDLANLRISERITGINTWLKVWYDFNQHPNATPIAGDKDVHQRLTRTLQRLEAWVGVFDEINYSIAVRGSGDGGVINRIRDPAIFPARNPISQCRAGRGNPAEWCGTSNTCCDVCCGEDDCWCCKWECTNYTPVTWFGIYGTCTGSGRDHNSHPVCRSGDLYRVTPPWCTDLETEVVCDHSQDCGYVKECNDPIYVNVKNDPAFYFQGQLSWDNQNGPTEIKQAREILFALKTLVEDFRNRIGTFGENARRIMRLNEETKKELVYCWNDVKPGTMESNEVYHAIRVNLEGYPKIDSPNPEENFPGITVEKPWWSLGGRLQICKRVTGSTSGKMNLSVSRYDSDIPGFWWNMRRRKVGGEVSKDTLKALQKDILEDGIVNKTSDLDAVKSVAIESEVEVSYGRLKTDINLLRVK